MERPLGEELALFDVERGVVHTLNPSATVVWKALDDASSRADLVSALRKAFEVEPVEAERGVAEALEMLERADLLERA
jgi:PqqD family protein of HPr-rel-A system